MEKIQKYTQTACRLEISLLGKTIVTGNYLNGNVKMHLNQTCIPSDLHLLLKCTETVKLNTKSEVGIKNPESYKRLIDTIKHQYPAEPQIKEINEKKTIYSIVIPIISFFNEMSPGIYDFPFQILLTSSLPASFIYTSPSSYGAIKYTLHSIIFNNSDKITSKINLNVLSKITKTPYPIDIKSYPVNINSLFCKYKGMCNLKLEHTEEIYNLFKPAILKVIVENNTFFCMNLLTVALYYDIRLNIRKTMLSMQDQLVKCVEFPVKVQKLTTEECEISLDLPRIFAKFLNIYSLITDMIECKFYLKIEGVFTGRFLDKKIRPKIVSGIVIVPSEDVGRALPEQLSGILVESDNFINLQGNRIDSISIS
ncbi:hypothetical protein SteCoe_12161 [Stentor coeruleus]|uniref:Arrestin-like N-terminal domain-containing protein n=1 Tax=Stentor coeruleus TaxID=5963 RepID=A0A1R2CBH8_9CILI|nr:hypothetical protein SteCoe_12161 [Stentor coeruleus]